MGAEEMPDTPNEIDARTGQEPDHGSRNIPAIPFRIAIFVWLKISLLSFGGPAGQIAVMHRLLVDELKWVSERRFLDALNFCMLLPGPEAQQLTIYLGWLLHRVRGGVVAGLLFVLPGAVTVLALSMIYVHYQQAAAMGAAFFGIKAAVLAIVLSAVWRLSQRVLHQRLLLVIALVSFLSSFVFAVPFPLVIAGAALAGYLFSGRGEGTGDAPDHDAPGHDAPGHDGSAMRPVDRIASQHQHPSWQKSLLVLMICGGIWLGPLLGLSLVLGPAHIFTQQGLFFSQVAVVSFGGAYAVLAYMAQQTVSHYGWLTPREMLDGLGLAETTPGPADHGDAVCRFSWRVPEPGHAGSHAGWNDQRSCYDMDDICPLLFVDFSGRSLHRIPAQQSRACPCLVGHNSCSCRCGAEPCDLVWSSGAVCCHGRCSCVRSAVFDDRDASAGLVQF
jgi:chromate transporter